MNCPHFTKQQAPNGQARFVVAFVHFRGETVIRAHFTHDRPDESTTLSSNSSDFRLPVVAASGGGILLPAGSWRHVLSNEALAGDEGLMMLKRCLRVLWPVALIACSTSPRAVPRENIDAAGGSGGSSSGNGGRGGGAAGPGTDAAAGGGGDSGGGSDGAAA